MLKIYLIGWLATSVVSYKVFFLEPNNEAIKRLRKQSNKTREQMGTLLNLEKGFVEDAKVYKTVTAFVWFTVGLIIWPLFLLALFFAQKALKEKMVQAFLKGEVTISEE